VWLNRYSLLENAAEDLLLEQGIKAELSIESVSKTQAVLKNISGDLDIQMKDDSSNVDVDVALSRLSHPALKAQALNIKGAFMPDIKGDVVKASGDINVSFESLIIPQAERDSSRNYLLAAEGDWEADITGVSLPDVEQRRSLSKTLSLSDALLNAPIAQNFSTDLTRNIERK